MTLTKRWIIPGVLALALASGAGAIVLAQGPGAGGPRGPRGGFGMGGPGGPHGMMGGMAGLGRLDLSDAQREQVKSIMQARRADMKAIGDRLRPARKALQDAIAQTPVNEALVRQRAADLAAVEADAAVLRARVHAEVFALLTPEQQQKARDLRAQMEQRMQQRDQRFQNRREQKKPGE